MANIELVLKIPEDVYRYAKKYNGSSMLTLREEEMGMCMNAIANGTPLPKGHGALKDADRLLETWYDNFCEFMTQTELDSMNNIIKNASTIIEADREDEDADSN